MASTELYSSQSKRKKKLTFGQVLGDSLLSAGRTTLGGTGLDNIITDDMFASEEAAKFSNQVGSIINPVKQQILSTFGMANIPTGPDTFAMGGKKDKPTQELTGPTIRGKQYPKGTIVTNDLELYQRNQDSLNMYNRGKKLFDKETNSTLQILLDNYNAIQESEFLTEEEKREIPKPTLGDFYKYSESGLSNYEPSYYSEDVEKLVNSNPNIKPTGYFSGEGAAYAPFYKKPSSMIFEDRVNRMTPKGLPTSTQPIPQMLNMPDRIEKDSRTGAEYKGLKVSHYTDGLGRYTAKLNLTTTPGVEGRISYAGGGLRTFEGNTHEQGGIKLGNDEVEDSETMVNLSPDSDYIFSDRIIVPDTKQSFAAKSKRISKKYSLRPNDPYGKKSEELELKRLANEQELVKSKSKSLTTNANHMAMGGKRYVNGGPFEFVPKVVDPLFQSNVSGIEDYKFGEEFNKLYNPSLIESKVTPLTSNSEIGVNEFDYGSSTEPSKSKFLIPALGYAAQAATNIPALLTKPETINSARVKFGKLNLAEQRNEARRNRNLALATAKGIGANDTGQMMNYLSGATAALNSAYGNQFNQSLLAEQEANLETNMREQLANSEIERYDEQINAQERDAARSLRMNALQNLGTISAMTGKDYLSMQQTDDYLSALSVANPDYGLRGRTPYRKRAYGGTRKRAIGGKY